MLPLLLGAGAVWAAKALYDAVTDADSSSSSSRSIEDIEAEAAKDLAKEKAQAKLTALNESYVGEVTNVLEEVTVCLTPYLKFKSNGSELHLPKSSLSWVSAIVTGMGVVGMRSPHKVRAFQDKLEPILSVSKLNSHQILEDFASLYIVGDLDETELLNKTASDVKSISIEIASIDQHINQLKNAILALH